MAASSDNRQLSPHATYVLGILLGAGIEAGSTVVEPLRDALIAKEIDLGPIQNADQLFVILGGALIVSGFYLLKKG